MRIFAAIGAVISLTAPVHAEPVEAVTAKVIISDLDLASPQGQRVLKRRVAAAVEQVCGPYAHVVEQYGQMQLDACQTAAMSDARRQSAAKLTTLRLAVSRAR